MVSLLLPYYSDMTPPFFMLHSLYHAPKTPEESAASNSGPSLETMSDKCLMSQRQSPSTFPAR